MRITCDTAAQCERLADLQRQLVLDAVITTVLVLVLLVVVWHLYRVYSWRA
jgi:hypothetical protein